MDLRKTMQQVGRPRRWEDNIKMDVNWSNWQLEHVQWQVLVLATLRSYYQRAGWLVSRI
jgi:hypothetical protein